MPPLLLGACVLFWGVENNLLPLALPIASLIESWRLVRWRWDLDTGDFNRVADLTSLGFAILSVYQFIDKGLHAVFAILLWLPALLTPLLVLQLYSQRGTTPLAALFVSLRRQQPTSLLPAGDIDLGPPFFVTALVAASAGNDRSLWFYAGVSVFLAWAVFRHGPRRRVLPCAALLTGAVGLGFAGQLGLERGQMALESIFMEWLQDRSMDNPLPDRAFTAIGMVGRLKFSDRIRVRVRSPTSLATPLLLREASYSTYNHGIWRNPGKTMTAIETMVGPRHWRIGPTAPDPTELAISARLREQTGVVPVPAGTFGVKGEAILQVHANAYGTIMLESRPGYIDYRVEFGGAAAGPAATTDLEVPADHGEAFAVIADSLNLRQMAPLAAITAVRDYFARNFRYSLVQRGSFPWSRPLIDFLQRRREGHCEYFATATTLLLRSAGIPARYAVGYAVSEYSPLEGAYIARARDAHAWSLAHVDGVWLPVDTTPSTWRALEDDGASAFAAAGDFASWLGYRLAHWRDWLAGLRDRLYWLLLPLSLVLTWRLSKRRRIAIDTVKAAPRHRPGPGLDSEFLLWVERTAAAGQPLVAGETLERWLRRLPPTILGASDRMLRLHRLHSRLRFDPAGLTTQERLQLRAAFATERHRPD
jgi:transglutaminase-like putative cysteine protease